MRSGGVSLLLLVACGARPAAIGSCDPGDDHLVVCFAFEGDATDSSSHRLDAETSDVAFAPGKVGTAMQFGPQSTAYVPDSPVFDLQTLTIEAWIQPRQMPTFGTRAGIVDVNAQYGFYLHPGRLLSCSMDGGPTVLAASAAIATDTWTHVACTYDRRSAVLYINGAPVARALGSSAPSAAGTTGLSIASDYPPGPGSQLIGLVDEVRLLDVARTAEQICADAGRLHCP